MTWEEVIAVHGTYNGIAKKDGKLSSILCGNKYHGDIIMSNEIIYSIPNRNSYEKIIELFVNAQKEANPITVYHKLKINSWENLGEYIIKKLQKTDVHYKITFLRKS